MSQKRHDPTLEAAMRHHAQGRLAEAEPLYRRAVARQSDTFDALRGLGLLLHQRGDNEAAAELLHRAVTRRPNLSSVRHELGVVLRLLGRLSEAERELRAAADPGPGSAQLLTDLRHTFKERGRLAEAVDFFAAYGARHPSSAAAHYHYGRALLADGSVEAALDALRACLRLAPADVPARRALVDALIYRGRHGEAAQAAREAVDADPNDAVGWSLLGKALQRMDRLAESVQYLATAIRLKPDLAEAYLNLGVTTREQGQFDAAVACCTEAIRLRPDHADSHNQLGLAYGQSGRPAEAAAAYRRAIELDPGQADGYGPYLMALNRDPSAEPAAVFAAYRGWAGRYADPLTAAAASHANDPDPDRRLRLGYVSPDLREHSVAYFIEPVLARHDRGRFEVTCYANVKAPDAVTRRLRDLGHRWRDVVATSDHELAAAIRADRIDVLIDLAGHTTDHRLLAFARRPAPVQVTYLGYPNTTGMRAMDWRVTDAVADPPGTGDACYAERLYRLASPFLCYRPPADAPSADRRPGPPFTFGAFNAFAKVTPDMLALWARILAASPGSRLLLKGKGLEADDAPRRLVVAAMSSHGVDPTRVELVGKQPSTAGHLDVYREVDVALDTHPYAGTTTTCEALWMSVPVVTLAGTTHAARVGATLLSAVGLPAHVARSADEYVRIAAGLAANPTGVAVLRSGMRERLRRSPLMDEREFTARLEDAYRQMWRAWCAERAGARPRSAWLEAAAPAQTYSPKGAAEP